MPLTPARIAYLCDRHVGVGSDGLLLLDGQTNEGFGLRIVNPDGSEAEKSGNGIRIFAKWLRDTGRASTSRFTVRTLGGDVPVEVSGDAELTLVDADMGEPLIRSDLEWLDLAGEHVRVVALSLGNPHCVVVRPDATQADLYRLGPAIERHRAFPSRTNVQLAWPEGRDRARALIWERGAGETRASGSSACAVAVALQQLGLVDRDVTVVMAGGELPIRRDAVGHVWMRGPAEEIARVTLSDELIARLRALR